MKRMKCLLFACILAVLTFSGCGKNDDNVIVLRVNSWEEYIDEGDWEEGEEIELVLIRDDGRFILPEVTHNISHVVRKELGYELFDFHSLRHTHATELCENGVNLKEIQRRLGHKSFEVTNRIYLHATDAMERESMEIMKKMYGEEN